MSTRCGFCFSRVSVGRPHSNIIGRRHRLLQPSAGIAEIPAKIQHLLSRLRSNSRCQARLRQSIHKPAAMKIKPPPIQPGLSLSLVLDVVEDLSPADHSPSPVDEKEIDGPKGLEPTRFGDWERKGRCVDF